MTRIEDDASCTISIFSLNYHCSCLVYFNLLAVFLLKQSIILKFRLKSPSTRGDFVNL